MASPETAPCLFCRIARGEVPSHAIHSTPRLHAFLDINPIRPGHVQIIPREHFAYFEMLPPELAAEIVQLGQDMARRLKRLYGVPRVAFLFSGNDIAHAHAHLVPMVAPTDITSLRYIEAENIRFRSTPRVPDAELAATAAALRAASATP